MLSPRRRRWLGPLLGLVSVAFCTTAASAKPPPFPEPGEAAEVRLCLATDRAGVAKCFEVCHAKAAHAVWVVNRITGESGVFDCDDLTGPSPKKERL